ncbi:hypothetical protein J437_LFUL013766 [Ladona fulva]|uniref:Glycosyltransferase n=1 Tax=Ladona fulva TaxID=123851 RepID=A0A8K0P7E6_LADFU|nr:hypothetical protein J437_LFUL013766 [Ladona fulva]
MEIHEEKEWVFFVWRFKPDNIMHVLHDDLLPMYYTYEGICGGNVERCINDYKLIFVDDVTSAFSSDLYEIFSKEKSYLGDGEPVFLRDYWRNYSDSLICFKHARVGISRATTWFQYGFGKPQGAIENSNVTVSVFRKFSRFLIQKMGLQTAGFQCKEDKFPPRALFLTRNISRRILNEEDVIKTTKNVYSSVVGSTLNVEHFNPFSNSSVSEMREILKVVTDLPPISFVFGMHGAALTVITVLSLAANVGCNPLVIMELFPMGIDPDAVSPIKALAKLPWLQNSIIYESWTNKDPANSEMPSTYLNPLQGGGLMCQGMDLRETLRAVHCCHNKEYICRMFQDTIVDLKGEYVDKLRLLFTQQKEFKQDNMTINHQEFKWYFPAPVTNVSCRWNLKILVLELLWKQSLNVYNLKHHYDITVILETEKVPGKDDKLKGNGDAYTKKFQQYTHQKKDYFLKVSEPLALIAIPEEFLSLPKILRAMVWIQCVVNLKHQDNSSQRKSLDTYHTCSTSL